ncbi:SprT family zinc-dependent metalloprotease [soil metagenome]
MNYQIQHHPRAQHIKIKITPQAEVIVVVPRDCPTFFIDRFVKEHSDWIEKNLKKIKDHQPTVKKNKDEMLLFGKSYLKVIGQRSEFPLGVRVSGNRLIITPVTENKTSIDKSLQQFLKNTAEKYITPRTHQLAKEMKTTFKTISFKNQKTRWGSCSSLGNLNFNWRLVHVPPPVIDYVLIHELAHRTEMNHSADFWEIVRRFDPEYLKHRGYLKREGMDLG